MKTARLQLFVASGICVAMLFGYWFWYGVVAGLGETAASLASQIAEKEATANGEVSGRSALAEVAASEALVQSYFVSEEKVTAFIDDLQAQGRSQGVAVTITSVSKTGAGVKTVLALSLSIEGKFDSVMRMVGMIEYAANNSKISSLTLTQSDKNTWRADTRVTVGSIPTTAQIP